MAFRRVALLSFFLVGCQNLAQHDPASTLADCDRDGDLSLGEGAGCAVNDERADCDDDDPAIHPGALEVCDGVDNDCSGVVDDASDGDADGANACEDCDDADPAMRPGAPELCNGLDEDCDGVVDEGFDADGDGYSPCDGDCDDADPRRASHLTELCNGYDDDCDDVVDEGYDVDVDGWSTCRGDCDDGDPAVYWGAVEVCDGVDQDCDGGLDDLPECYGCSDLGGLLVCPTPASWSVARGVCEAMAAGLIELSDGPANDALAVSLAAGGETGAVYWIGATDSAAEGEWRWASGDAVVYHAWELSQPDDLDGEDCAAADALGAWQDLDCDSLVGFVCW